MIIARATPAHVPRLKQCRNEDLIADIATLNLARNTTVRPLKARAVPSQRIFVPARDPVSLVRKRKERAGHTLRLQRPEQGQRLCRGRPVVLVAVCDEHRRRVTEVNLPIWPCRVELLEVLGLNPRKCAFAKAAVVDNLVRLQQPGRQAVNSVVPDGTAKLGACQLCLRSNRTKSGSPTFVMT